MTPPLRYKVNVKLCDTCPCLEHCIAFPYLPLGHHPGGRCPDGFMEKIIPEEIPGPNYKRGGGKFGEKVVDSEIGTWATFNRESYSGYKGRQCLACGGPVSRASRYRLCRGCARGFVAWRARHREYMERRKREHRERGVFLLGRRGLVLAP